MNKDVRYRLEVVAPILPVTDIGRSLAYYREALMFETGFEWSDSEDEPVRYAVLQCGNTELHLSETKVARETRAYVFVDGVAAYYSAVMQSGAVITCAIEDHPWEMREFEIADPDGNRLVFGEHLSRIDGADAALKD